MFGKISLASKVKVLQKDLSIFFEVKRNYHFGVKKSYINQISISSFSDLSMAYLLKNFL
jgi:hypothetical protein